MSDRDRLMDWLSRQAHAWSEPGEIRRYIRKLEKELEKAKADSKRLEKFFQHDIKLFTATRDAQGIIELVSPANREAFDERVKELEEPE